MENSVSDEEPSEEEEEEEEDEQEEDDVENDEDTFVSANDEGFSFDPQDSLKVPPVQTSKQNSTEGSSGQKLSAAGSRISARRAQMLQRNLLVLYPCNLCDHCKCATDFVFFYTSDWKEECV